MLSRLFSGPDAAGGRGHAVTAVGDPNQAIYGWRGASVSNILNFADDLPGGRRVGADLPAHRQPPLRPAHPRGGQPARRAPLRPLRPGRPARAQAGRRAGQSSPPRSSRPRPTSSSTLVARGPGGARRRPARGPTIGVLTRDNAHAEDVFDALDRRRRSRSRSSASRACCGCPRSPRWSRSCTCSHDPTANASLLTLLTGPRWAIGPRDLRLLAERARELAGGSTRLARRGATIRDHLVAIADGIDPAEIPALGDALDEPGRGGLLRRGARALRAARRRAAAAARVTSASRCSTSCAASSTPPASTSSSPPRSTRRRPRGATTSTSS